MNSAFLLGCDQFESYDNHIDTYYKPMRTQSIADADYGMIFARATFH